MLIRDLASLKIPTIIACFVKYVNFFGLGEWNTLIYRYELIRILFGVMNLFAGWFVIMMVGLVISPFFFPVRVYIMDYLIYCLTIISRSLYNLMGVPEIVMEPLGSIVWLHRNLFWIYRILMKQSFHLFVNWILNSNSWISIVLFYAVWITSTVIFAVISFKVSYAYVQGFSPLFGIMHSYLGILGLAARLCYSMSNILGEIILILVALLWISLPLILTFYCQVFTFVLPSLLVCSVLLFAAKKELNDKWKQYKN